MPQITKLSRAEARELVNKLAQEVPPLIAEIVGGKTVSIKKSDEAASKIAYYLTDRFSDRNDVVTRAVRKIVEYTKESLPASAKARLQDMIDVALARVDRKASFEYWLKDDEGNPITLTTLQRFMLDFQEYAHLEVLVPIMFCPTGTGKSTIMIGNKAFEIGQNPNILEQLICANDSSAEKRGMAVRNILESPHYKKVFPQIKPDRQRWSNHELLVNRSRIEKTAEVTRMSKGDANAIDPTLTCAGVTSGQLGSRSHFSDFDDLATEENSVFRPAEGKRIYTLLTVKWFTRKKSPLGMKETDYDRKKAPWRGRVIGTPWAYDDPIYSMRDWPGAATVVIGINRQLTAYNVQVWGLPDEYIKLLTKKYTINKDYKADGTIVERNDGLPATSEFAPLSDKLTEFCKKSEIPIIDRYTLGEGEVKDKNNPPKITFELPLSRPREWYLEELMNAKDVKQEFDRPYRCDVYVEGELAYPGFGESLYTYYPDYPTQAIDIGVDDIHMNRKGANERIGSVAYMIDPPGRMYYEDGSVSDEGYKIAMVDLSGMSREGTVLMVATLTPNHRRRIIEVVKGAFAPEEISDQIDGLFKRHRDLLLCYVESVALQKLFVDEMTKHMEAYPWWGKIAHFEETTTNKNDQQIGILAMGTTLASGGFELPNTYHDRYARIGHGRTCRCGYCTLIRDASIQTRLAPVKSDVLITLWGIHISMPHSFDGGEPVEPSGHRYAPSGIGLMQRMGEQQLSAYGEAVLGLGFGRGVIRKRPQEDGGDDEEIVRLKKLPLPVTRRTVASHLGGLITEHDDGWNNKPRR